MAVLSTKLAFVTMVTMALLVMANGFVVKIENELKEVFNVEKEFDYFTLALSWPATYCALSTKCCEQNACCKGSEAPTGFIIRGLWPERKLGNQPTCCQNKPYKEAEILPLLHELNKHMPTLGCSMQRACDNRERPHLAYVWEKHGTCAFPLLRGQYAYFAATLDLYYRHNVTALLKEAGYGASSTPSDSLVGIISTIKKVYGAKPHITCSKSAIADVHLCFDKNFQPRDCAQAIVSCPEKVSLPPSTPRGHKVWTENPLIEELEAL